jgi:hypothetical protein
LGKQNVFFLEPESGIPPEQSLVVGNEDISEKGFGGGRRGGGDRPFLLSGR